MAESNVVPFESPEQEVPVDHDAMAVHSAIQGLEGDPEEAAESERLGNALSIPGSVVSTDPDNYKRMLKQKLVSDFLTNNEHLREYVKQHPLGAKVSADDWGQLDKISGLADKFQGVPRLGGALNLASQILPSALGQMAGKMVDQTVGPQSLVGSAARGFADKFGTLDFGDESGRTPEQEAFATQHPLVNAFIRDLLIRSGLDPAVELPLKTFSGLVGGAHAVTRQLALRAGESESSAESFANTIAGMAEYAPFHTTGIPEAHIPPAVKPKVEPQLLEPQKPLAPGEAGVPPPPGAVEFAEGLPWFKAGKAPPIRIGELVLDAAKEDIKNGIKDFDELYKETQKSATLPRSPDSIVAFHNIKFGDSTIGISADKVKELYGDATPIPGDNKLGWIWDIEEQHQASLGGRDITVPIKDFLAHVTPEVYDVVKDGLRLNHDGLTLDEAKEAKPFKPDEIQLTRKGPVHEDPILGAGTHLFEVKRNGETVAQLQIFEEDDPKTIRAEWLGGLGKEPGTVNLGVSGIRGILDRIKEQFPEAEKLVGERITGARAEAGTERDVTISLKKEAPKAHEVLRRSAGLEPDYAKGWEVAEGGTDQPEEVQRLKLPTGTDSAEMPGRYRSGTSTFTFKLKDILPQLKFDSLPGDIRTLSEFWARLLKREVGETPVHIAHRVELQGMFPEAPRNFGGLHWNNNIYIPEDMLDQHPQLFNLVVIHEAGHALTVNSIEKFPFIKSDIRSVMDELKKTGVDLKDLDYAYKNEKEFVAEGMANGAVRRVLQNTPATPEVVKRFGLTKERGTFWDAIKNIISNLWGELSGKKVEPSMMDAFMRIMESIDETNKFIEEIGDLKPDASPSFAEIPEEQLAKSPFKDAAISTVKQRYLERYLKLLKDQQDRSVKESRDLEQMEAAKKATQEWKDNYPRMREQARQDVFRTPRVAADRFLRTGELPNGEKIKKLKIDPATVDPEFRRELPDSYLSEDGAHPDDLAPIFGYQSGDKMIRDLVSMERDREANDITPASYLRQMVDQETQRRMVKEYGVSPADIIDRAEQHVVNPTALDLLITELQALSPQEEGISKFQFERHARKIFNRLPSDTHDYMKYINAMGREGQKAEEALLDGKVSEAFDAKQRQAFNAFMAKFTKDLEKTKNEMEVLEDRYSKRKPTASVTPIHVNAIQTILMKVSDKIKRTPEDIASQWNLLADTRGMDLKDWVFSRNNIPEMTVDVDSVPLGQTMRVEDWLLDPEFGKPWKAMTPPELRALVGSIRSIEKDGREMNTLLVKGKREDLRRTVTGLVTRLREAVDGKKTTPDDTNALRTIGSLILTPETWFRRLDLGNEHGPFSQLFTRKIVEGQYDRALTEQEMSKKWRELGDFGDTRKKVENTLFRDPLSKFQEPLEMTQGHVWAVLANMGNKEQRRKLAAGYGISNPDLIWSWLQQHGVTEADVARAQRMGDFFSDLYGRAERMYTDLAGWAGERVELESVMTPWGEINEWYHPLIPDPIRHQALSAKDMMPETGFTRAMPVSGYTKKRTGALYPIQLNFDAIPSRVKQMINDISMRPAIHEVSKVAFDKEFRDNFTLYYGKEYSKQLTEWLKDSAGVGQFTSAKESAIVAGVNFIRQNMVTLLIGFNMGTIAKHVPTAAIYSAMETENKGTFFQMLNKASPYVNQRRAEAFDKSAELQTRKRQVKEGMYAANEDLFRGMGFESNFWTAREWASALGATPIAAADLYFSTALWVAKYDEMIGKKFSEGDAIYSANTAVRRTHGSTIIAAKPAIMRMHPLVQALMPFYTFFNNSLQRNYEAAWKAKMSLSGRTLSDMQGFEKEEFDKGLKNLAPAMGGLLLFSVIPSLIEEIVDPVPTDEDENWIKWGARVISRAPLAMIPFVRDAASFALEGRDPSAGILGSFARSTQGAVRDVKKALSGDEWDPDPAKTIRHFNTAMGSLGGLTWEQPARTGQFIYNYMNDNDDPETIREWWNAIHKGHSKEIRR